MKENEKGKDIVQKNIEKRKNDDKFYTYENF